MSGNPEPTEVTVRSGWFIAQQLGVFAMAATGWVVLWMGAALALVPVVAIPVTCAAAIPAAWVLARIARTHARVNAHGLSWSDCWGSGRASWSEISALTVTSAYPMPPVQVGYFTVMCAELVGGSVVRLWGASLLTVDQRDRLFATLQHFSRNTGCRIAFGCSGLTSAVANRQALADSRQYLRKHPRRWRH